MHSWKTKPLGELCQLINGRAFKPADWGTSGLPIVRIQNLNDERKPFNYYSGDYRDSHFINNGEILLSWSGTPGTSFGCFRWTRGPAILNQHIFNVLSIENMDGDFFIHAVNSNLEEMIAKSHGGVGLQHITNSKLEAIRLPAMELGDQRAIVQKIDECFLKLSEISALQSECIKQANATLPSALNEVFSRLKESYREHTVGELALETRYGTSQKCGTVEKGTPVLRIPNVSNGFVNFSNLKYCELESRELAKLLLESGDLLFVRTNGSRELVGR